MIKYCPKCHREAYRLVEENGNIKVMQGKNSIINVSRSSSVSMNIGCPNGHSVKLEIKPEEGDNGGSQDRESTGDINKD